MMRKNRLLVTFLILSFFSITLFAVSPEVDQTTGFRDVKFGTNITEIKGLKVKKVVGNHKEGIRKKDDKKIGNAECESITYLFYKDQFYGIIAVTDNATIINPILDKYGASDPTETYDFRSWTGEKVKISIMTLSGKLILSILYLPISDIESEELKKDAKLKPNGL